VIMLIPALLFIPPIVFAVIVAAIWTALDAARRGQNWFAWGVAVAVTGVAFPAWLIARRRFEPVAGHRGGAFGARLVTGILFIVALDFLLMWSVRAFLFQVARVEGTAMSPTANDQDRLIVDKSVYRGQVPRVGDVVMLYYPLNPDKTFLKRVIAEEGDQIRIVDGHVYPERRTDRRRVRPGRVPEPRRLRSASRAPGLLLRHGGSSQQQFRQQALGLRAPEIHHRKGGVPMVAAGGSGRCALIRIQVTASAAISTMPSGLITGRANTTTALTMIVK
jgi:Signal peptidase, peptidase S26